VPVFFDPGLRFFGIKYEWCSHEGIGEIRCVVVIGEVFLSLDAEDFLVVDRLRDVKVLGGEEGGLPAVRFIFRTEKCVDTFSVPICRDAMNTWKYGRNLRGVHLYFGVDGRYVEVVFVADVELYSLFESAAALG